MKEPDLKKIRKAMEKELDPKRYEHTLGVAYTAASLAMCYGADLNSALMQCQCSGNIQDFIHTGPGGLGHAAARIGGEGFEIAPGALSVEHAQCKG